MPESAVTSLGGTSEPGARLSSAIRLAARLAAFMAVGVGAVVLLGWWSGVSALTSPLPGSPPMKSNTAVLLIAGGGSLLIAIAGWRRWLAVIGAAFLVLVTGLTVAEYVSGVSIGIDRLLARSPGPLPGAPYPGRIALQTALALLAAGVALLVLGRSWHGVAASELLGVACASMGTLGLLGYAFGAETLASLGSGTRSSLLASVGVCSLGVGIVLGSPRHHLVRYFSDPGVAGQFARRMLPAVLIVLPLAGALDEAAVRAGLLDEGLGDVLTISVEIMALVAIGAWLSGRTLQLELARMAQEAGARAREAEAKALLEQRREEAERHALEDLYHTTLDGMLEGAMIIDRGWRYVYVNDAASRHGHAVREHLIGRTMQECYPGIEASEIFHRYRACMEDRVPQRFDAPFTFADGSVGTYAFSVEPVPEGIFVLSIDVSEQARAEARLREQHSTLRGIIDGLPALIYSVDREYRYTSFNTAHAEVMRSLYGAEIAVGRPILSAITLDADRVSVKANIDRALAGEELAEEVPSGRADARRYFRVSHSPIRSADAVIGVVVLGQDVTGRREAEEAQRRMNRELHAISTCHQVLMRAADEPSLLQEICRIVCEAAGYRMAWVGYPEHDAAQTLRPAAWAGHEDGYLANVDISWGDSERGRGPTGTAIRTGMTVYVQDIAADARMKPWLDAALARGFRSSIALPLADDRGSPFGVLTIYAAEPNAFIPEELRLLEELAADLAFGITVLRSRATQERMAAQLRQAQKMEVVGQLAGGIAHDFNNLLTAIRGYGELLQAEVPGGEPATIKADLAEILGAATQAELLTRHLLAFARRQVLVPVVLSPAETVERLAPMLRRMLGEQVDLVVRSDQPSGMVRVDPGQLEQVILNLAVNARDAMPGGGQLTLETADVELGEEDAATHPGTTPGWYVSLTVSDTGVGMDPETQGHLFEPFFTTKPEGQGTGLGLATVYGIVRQSDGSIAIYSEPGRGTRVRICLPRTSAPSGLPASADESGSPIPAGTETILLVEDDPAIRAYAARVLVPLGYTVLEAASGADALGLAAADARQIHLVVTDIVMPGMQGTELARQLATARPGIRVMFMSGFDRGALGQAGLDGGQTFLAKPFTREALVRAVRSALDAPINAGATA